MQGSTEMAAGLDSWIDGWLLSCRRVWEANDPKWVRLESRCLNEEMGRQVQIRKQARMKKLANLLGQTHRCLRKKGLGAVAG